jgi:hypothetical protein
MSVAPKEANITIDMLKLAYVDFITSTQEDKRVVPTDTGGRMISID